MGDVNINCLVYGAALTQLQCYSVFFSTSLFEFLCKNDFIFYDFDFGPIFWFPFMLSKLVNFGYCFFVTFVLDSIAKCIS